MDHAAWLAASERLEKALSGRELVQRRQAARSQRRKDKADYKDWAARRKPTARDHRTLDRIVRRSTHQAPGTIGYERGWVGNQHRKLTERLERYDREAERRPGIKREQARRAKRKKAAKRVAGAAAIGGAAATAYKLRNNQTARDVARGALSGLTVGAVPMPPKRNP